MEVLWLLLNAQQGLQVCPHTFILPWEVLMVEVPSKSIEKQILSLLMVSQHYPLLVATTFWVIPKDSFHVSFRPDKLGGKGAVELAASSSWCTTPPPVPFRRFRRN